MFDMIKQNCTIINRNESESIAHACEEEVHSVYHTAYHSFVVRFDVDDTLFACPEYGKNIGFVVRKVVPLTKGFVVDILVGERENSLLLLTTLKLRTGCQL